MREYYEDGTDEGREFAQKMTPGQEVESYINEAQKELKSNKKKHFSQVFQNPLKGFPHNEEFEVKEIQEDLDDIEGLIDEELMEASFPASLIKKAQDLAKKMGGNMTGATKRHLKKIHSKTSQRKVVSQLVHLRKCTIEVSQLGRQDIDLALLHSNGDMQESTHLSSRRKKVI